MGVELGFTLREECGLAVLRKTFGPRRIEMRGKWKKLQ